MTTHRTQIFFINQYYDPFYAATGQLIGELARSVVEQGYQVTVITGKNGRQGLPGSEEIRGVRVRRVKNVSEGRTLIGKGMSYNIRAYVYTPLQKHGYIFGMFLWRCINIRPAGTKREAQNRLKAQRLKRVFVSSDESIFTKREN